MYTGVITAKVEASAARTGAGGRGGCRLRCQGRRCGARRAGMGGDRGRYLDGDRARSVDRAGEGDRGCGCRDSRGRGGRNGGCRSCYSQGAVGRHGGCRSRDS